MGKTTKLEKSISAVGIVVLYTNHPDKYVWSLILTQNATASSAYVRVL